jgi:hypothetical protein
MAKAKAASKTPDQDYTERLALYEKLVATNPKVKRKGAALPYTAINGNMFSLFNQDAVLLLRLDKTEREAFAAKYRTKPVVMYGAVMAEYVAVPDALLAKTAQLTKYFEKSFSYVSSLKPKPTTKKKKA